MGWSGRIHLPELDLSEIDRKKFLLLVKKHEFIKPIEVFVLERFEEIWR